MFSRCQNVRAPAGHPGAILQCVTAQNLQVGSLTVPPGQARSGFLEVPGGADGGTRIPVTVINGSSRGPALGLIAGIHGYGVPSDPGQPTPGCRHIAPEPARAADHRPHCQLAFLPEAHDLLQPSRPAEFEPGFPGEKGRKPSRNALHM